jgi:hypothetical protein
MERARPGSQLRQLRGWYTRAILVTFGQLAITLITARLWIRTFGAAPVFHLAHWNAPLLEGFVP